MGSENRPCRKAVVGLPIGKTDSGVVNVSSLWANEEVYWPVAFEPYTPAHHFEGGKENPEFRAKLKIAKELVEQALYEGITFAAVEADNSTAPATNDLIRCCRASLGLVMQRSHRETWLRLFP